MARLSFLWKILGRQLRLQSRTCPYCGGAESALLGRKKIFLELRMCRQCRLMYRYPKDEPEVSSKFYEEGYVEGMTTEVPDASTLERWRVTNFAETEKDLSEKIRIVQSLCDAGSVLDYGCSWGYGVYQFSKAGFHAVGYDISLRRACVGRERLRVKILGDRAELVALPDRSFDVIFASHVLEHLHNPRAAYEDWQRLLKPTGVLLIFVPNAGGEKASRLGTRWGPMIGEKHPLAIDASFLYHTLPQYGLIPAFCTSPYPTGALTLDTDPRAKTLSGDELLAVARPCDTKTKQLTE